MRTTRLPKEPLKKLNLKGPKVSRRKIGSKPRHDIIKAAIRRGVRDIVAQEDKLWMEMACKTLDISPALFKESKTWSAAEAALGQHRFRDFQKFLEKAKVSCPVAG